MAPSTLISEFEQQLAAGQVTWLRCDSCGELRSTLRSVCPSCLSREVSWCPAAPGGSILSYVVVHEAIATALETPYVIVHVELDDGVRLTANLLDVDPAGVRVGLRVRLTVDSRSGRSLPQFVFAGE